MAGVSDWSDDSDMGTVSNNNSYDLVAYFASLYDDSLVTCDTYLVDVIKHVELLYGSEMADRLRVLGLTKSDRKLSGLLLL
jgi:hypothetical protein